MEKGLLTWDDGFERDFTEDKNQYDRYSTRSIVVT